MSTPEQDEILRKGLTVLGYEVCNIALWEEELTDQGVNPLPSYAEIEAAANQWIDPAPDWVGFNALFLSDSNWLNMAGTIPVDLRYGIVSTSANGNAPGLQAAYNMMLNFLDSAGTSVPLNIKEEWQAIADSYRVPVIYV